MLMYSSQPRWWLFSARSERIDVSQEVMTTTFAGIWACAGLVCVVGLSHFNSSDMYVVRLKYNISTITIIMLIICLLLCQWTESEMFEPQRLRFDWKLLVSPRRSQSCTKQSFHNHAPDWTNRTTSTSHHPRMIPQAECQVTFQAKYQLTWQADYCHSVCCASLLSCASQICGRSVPKTRLCDNNERAGMHQRWYIPHEFV